MEKTKGLEVRLPLSGSMGDQLDQINDGLKRTGVNPDELTLSKKLEILNVLTPQNTNETTNT